MKQTYDSIFLATRLCIAHQIDIEHLASLLEKRQRTAQVLSRAASPASFFEVWRSVEDVAGQNGFGHKTAQKLSLLPWTEEFLAMATSVRLDEGLHGLARFQKLNTPVTAKILQSIGSLAMRFQSIDSSVEMPASYAYFLLLCTYYRACALTGVELRLAKISGPFSKAGLTTISDEVKTDATFAELPQLVFGRLDAKRPLLMGNPSFSAFSKNHLEARLVALNAQGSFSHRTREVIRETMSERRPSATVIAHALNVSESTLKRRLHAEGTAFQELLDNVRCSTAKDLLALTRSNHTEIAQTLGFRQVSSFSRSFRRWTGLSPSAYQDKKPDYLKKTGIECRRTNAPILR